MMAGMMVGPLYEKEKSLRPEELDYIPSPQYEAAEQGFTAFNSCCGEPSCKLCRCRVPQGMIVGPLLEREKPLRLADIAPQDLYYIPSPRYEAAQQGFTAFKACCGEPTWKFCRCRVPKGVLYTSRPREEAKGQVAIASTMKSGKQEANTSEPQSETVDTGTLFYGSLYYGIERNGNSEKAWVRLPESRRQTKDTKPKAKKPFLSLKRYNCYRA